MTRNPILNALAALLYIAFIATGIWYGPQVIQFPDTVLAPIAFLSLFVFSAACMGYIFLYHPLRLFLEGEKKTAVDLFIKTLLAFGVCVALFISVGVYLTLHL